MTPLIFLLFNIFSTSYSLTLSTSTSFTFSIFCLSTYSLYCTTQLMFTTRWILTEVGSCNLTTLVEITLSMIYGPIYWSTNFIASQFLNTRYFVLNIILSSFFYSSTFFLPLFACCFISSWAFLNVVPASSCTFLILSAISIVFSTSFFLISAPILNYLLLFAINKDTLVSECVLLLTTNSANTIYSG